jgi:hypothetical protein
MRLLIQPVVNVGNAGLELVEWGMTPTGNPVLRMMANGQTVLLELTPIEARDVGCGAIVAAAQTSQIQAELAARAAAPKILG